MKRILYFISILFCTMFFAERIEAVSISKDKALTMVRQQFSDQDVDYFILNEYLIGENDPYDSNNWWTFFVDADPMKGWEHECYIVKVRKEISDTVTAGTALQKELRSLPPKENFIPVNVKNRYGLQGNLKPIVRKDTVSNVVNSVAQRTYAVILSGGYNANSNYQRYWNDCSFIYQTLVNKYEVPKENIYPIMSDGDDPALDLRTVYGYSMSQPLDLDRDGEKDIYLSATKSNISQTLNSLASKLKKDDHLLFYVIDHGGSDDNDMKSFIWLWDEQKLYDTELAQMLTPFTKKLVNVNVVLGQCYSGGFIDDLTKIGCVVATACKGSEPSWSCSDKPYDEFVYHWTCAVNEATHSGTEVLSDADSNGRVTMEEAFEYAMLNDRRTEEHPQYKSTPISVGEDLAFNNLAPSVDLFLKDNPEDTGKEPNLTTDKFWLSPSVWIRNEEDDIYEHENPVYSSDHQMAFVYARVYNRGKEKFTGSGKWIHIYWAQASTGLTTEAWKGREVYNNYPTGGHLEAIPINDIINPGSYIDVHIGWVLPQLLKNYPEGNFHFCLFAKIMDTPYDDGYVDGVIYFDHSGKNDHVQKNVTIINKADFVKSFNVYVRNVISSNALYSLELIPQEDSDANIFKMSNIELEMSPKIYSAWERGGSVGQEIIQLDSDINEVTSRTVRFVSPNSKLSNIYLKEKEFDVVKIKFDLKKFTADSSTYKVDLVQKDDTGKIIGGETFIIKTPGISSIPVEITSTPQENNQVKLSVEQGGDFDYLIWKDSNGVNLGKGESLMVSPTADNKTYSIIALTDEGEVATDMISIKTEYGIKSVQASSNDLLIKFCTPSPLNSSISITSVEDGTIHLFSDVPGGETSVSIDSKSITDGIYVINYFVGSDVVDRVKFTLIK